jgi:hypothetical protein
MHVKCRYNVGIINIRKNWGVGGGGTLRCTSSTCLDKEVKGGGGGEAPRGMLHVRLLTPGLSTSVFFSPVYLFSHLPPSQS